MQYRAVFYLSSGSPPSIVATVIGALDAQRVPTCTIKERYGRSLETWIVGTRSEHAPWFEGDPSLCVIATFHCDSSASVGEALDVVHDVASALGVLAYKVETTPDLGSSTLADLLHFTLDGVVVLGLPGPQGAWFSHFEADRQEHPLRQLQKSSFYAFMLWGLLHDPDWPDAPPVLCHFIEPTIHDLSSLQDDPLETWMASLPWVEGEPSWFGEVGQQWVVSCADVSTDVLSEQLMTTLTASGWVWQDVAGRTPARWVVPAFWRAYREDAPSQHLDLLLSRLPEHASSLDLLSASLECFQAGAFTREGQALFVRRIEEGVEVFISTPGFSEDQDTPLSVQSCVEALRCAFA